MKKVNFLFSCLLLWMVGMTYAMAKTVTPYKVDFNSPIDTSEPDFAVAPGWDHQAPGVDNGWSLFTLTGLTLRQVEMVILKKPPVAGFHVVHRTNVTQTGSMKMTMIILSPLLLMVR